MSRADSPLLSSAGEDKRATLSDNRACSLHCCSSTPCPSFPYLPGSLPPACEALALPSFYCTSLLSCFWFPLFAPIPREPLCELSSSSLNQKPLPPSRESPRQCPQTSPPASGTLAIDNGRGRGRGQGEKKRTGELRAASDDQTGTDQLRSSSADGAP